MNNLKLQHPVINHRKFVAIFELYNDRWTKKVFSEFNKDRDDKNVSPWCISNSGIEKKKNGSTILVQIDVKTWSHSLRSVYYWTSVLMLFSSVVPIEPEVLYI